MTRHLSDYPDEPDCISSAALRAQIRTLLGRSVPNNMYSRYRAKAGILSSHAEGRKHTRQRTISPYRALLLIGACCWETTIRQELDCRVRLKDLLAKNLAIYMDQWLRETNGATLDHLLQWLDMASASYSGEDVARAIWVIASKNKKKATQPPHDPTLGQPTRRRSNEQIKDRPQSIPMIAQTRDQLLVQITIRLPSASTIELETILKILES